MASSKSKLCSSCAAGRHVHACDNECFHLGGGLSFFCECREPALSRRCGYCEKIIKGPYAVRDHHFQCARCAKADGWRGKLNEPAVWSKDATQ